MLKIALIFVSVIIIAIDMIRYGAHKWEYMNPIYQVTGDAANIIAIALFVYGVINWQRILQVIRGRGLGNNLTDDIKGLVVIASNNTANYIPEWLLHHKKPERLAIIYTKDSENKAKMIYDMAQKNGITCIHVVDAKYACNPLDYQKIQNTTQKFIQMLRHHGKLKQHEIFVDLTGGNVPMSLGVFMAAEKEQVSSIYTHPIRKDAEGKDVFISDGNYQEADMAKTVFMSNWSRHSG